MPDDVKDDVQEGEEESQALPIPDISAGSTEAGSEQPGFDVTALEKKMLDGFDTLKKSIPDLVDAGIKSTKDKRFNELSKAEEILAAVIESGGDPEKVRGNLERDERNALLSRVEALEKSGSGGASGVVPAEDAQKQQLRDEITELLVEAKAEHGVEVSNAEIEELNASKDFRSPLEYRNAMSSLIIKKAKQGNIGSGASAGESGTPVLPTDDQEILDEIEKLQGESFVRHSDKIKELTAEAEKRGLFN